MSQARELVLVFAMAEGGTQLKNPLFGVADYPGPH
jgi:hypothetical protein